MLSHRRRLLVILSLVLLVPARASLGEMDGRGDLEAELAEIRDGLERIKASYESRIEALEKKAGGQDALRAEIDEKEDEIRALKDQVMALEEGQGGGGLARRVERLEQRRSSPSQGGSRGRIRRIDESRHQLHCQHEGVPEQQR